MVFAKNLKTNRTIAIAVSALLGAGNFLQIFAGTNVFSMIPFGDVIVPFLSTLGLVWIAWGLHKHKI